MRLSLSPAFLLVLYLSPLISAQGNNNFPNLDATTTSASNTQASKTSPTGGSNSQTTATTSPKLPNLDPTTTTTSPKLPNIDPTTAAGGIPAGQAPTVTFNNGAAAVYTHAAPSVPPTALAPYMQKSSLPSGTVFIAVGAALGFFFFVVVAWRGVVAYSLRRSIKRANNPPLAKYQNGGGERTSMLRNAAPFYTNRPGSQMSLDHLGGGSRSGLKRESKANLFFSPTAGGLHQSMNRASTGYLPAGYYAAGNSAPGGGPPRPISMADFANNRPQSQGYQRARSSGPSPPVSPQVPAAGEMPYGSGYPAVSSLSLPSQGRAPSAYLEDLFDVPPMPEKGERYRDFS